MKMILYNKSAVRRKKNGNRKLKKVEEKIEKACERSGRSRSDVTLIAVSKTKPIEMMQEAMQAGVSIFGENKVQEIVKRKWNFRKT